jgi:isopenicillin-N epimerase
MTLTRRDFLVTAGTLTAVGTLTSTANCSPGPEPAPWGTRRSRDEWDRVRARIPVAPDYIHLAGLLIASHPQPVAHAIAQYRQGLDHNPAHFVEENRMSQERETRRAAARYLGVDDRDVALTDSTTMGIALVYSGIAIQPGQEIIVSGQDYYSTRESLRYKAERSGAIVRQITLFDQIERVTADEIVHSVISAVTPQTRVVAATWVHSSTGLKIPVRRIADELARINALRTPTDRVLLCLDGVHGFGVEHVTMADLGCDFYMAGAHKWLFGPRGTGVLWGNPETQAAVTPTIPTFTRDGTWGGRMTPGGFKPFEHQWALAEAFRFHEEIGKDRVQERIRALARQCKEGLSRMDHVRLYTPLDERLSAGIVCFDVEGMRPAQVVSRLRDRRIIASTTPYTPSHARLTPGLLNTPEEIDYTLEAIHALG